MTNQMIPQPPKLPAHVRNQIDLQRKQMHYVAQVAVQALDEESSVYSYSVYKTITTMASAEIWKKASVGTAMSPEMEAWFDHVTKDYMLQMASIPHEASWRILKALQDLNPEEVGDVGFIGELRAALMRWLES